MRIWIHSTVKTATIGQSTIVSIIAHAAFVVGAVYSTGVSASLIEQKIAERIFFLPPPDRRPASDYVAERLLYTELGRAALAPSPKAEDEVPRPGPELPKPLNGDAGLDVFSQAPSAASESKDSVYSVLDVEETAARTAGSAAPVYPPELMKEGIQGGVFIRFVVDTSGHADPGSIEVVRAAHPLFVESVKQAVPLMLFTPAMVGGRPVRQAVEQNFEFRLTASTPADHTKAKRP